MKHMGDGTKFTGMLLPPVLRARLNAAADKCDISISDLCRGLLDAGISRLEAASDATLEGEEKEKMVSRPELFEQWLISMMRLKETQPRVREYEI